MTVLLLGGSGYIGRHLRESFAAGDIIATYKTCRFADAVYYDALKMDLSDIIPSKPEITHAVIMYGETNLDWCKSNPVSSYETNVTSIKSVIDQLAVLGIKPVFISSDYVFAADKGCYEETDATAPETVYGAHKVEVEQHLAAFGHYLILRLAKVVGTQAHDGTLLTDWLQQILQGDMIWCADQKLSPIHITDVVRGAKIAIEQNLSGIYHLANPEAWNRVDLLQALYDCLGVAAEIRRCELAELNLVETRPADLSMNPYKFMAATEITFKTMEECCKELCRREKTRIHPPD